MSTGSQAGDVSSSAQLWPGNLHCACCNLPFEKTAMVGHASPRLRCRMITAQATSTLILLAIPVRARASEAGRSRLVRVGSSCALCSKAGRECCVPVARHNDEGWHGFCARRGPEAGSQAACSPEAEVRRAVVQSGENAPPGKHVPRPRRALLTRERRSWFPVATFT